MILMVIIRYISAVLVWILTSLVVLGSLGEVTFFVMFGSGFQRSNHRLCIFLSGDKCPLVALHRLPAVWERHVLQGAEGSEGGTEGGAERQWSGTARIRRLSHRLHRKCDAVTHILADM